MPTYPQGYEVHKKPGDYLKLKGPSHYFRILTEATLGWEDWQDGKPIRFLHENPPAGSVDPKKPVKEFHAFVVWNYKDKRIQIFAPTQKTIHDAFIALANDKAYGDLHKYDVRIFRQEKPKVSYVVAPEEPEPISDEIKRAFFARPCNLDALFEGEDPFAVNPSEGFTPAAFSEEKAAPVSSRMEKESKTTVSGAQKTSLEELIHKLDQEGVESAMVEDFVDSVAKKQTKSIEQVLMQCLKAYNSFKTSYSVFLNKRLSEQGSPHPA